MEIALERSRVKCRALVLLVLLVLPVPAQELAVVWGSRRLNAPTARLEFLPVALPSKFNLRAGKLSLQAAGLPEMSEWPGHSYPVQGQWEGRPWQGSMRVQSVEGNVARATILSKHASGWFRVRVEVIHYP